MKEEIDVRKLILIFGGGLIIVVLIGLMAYGFISPQNPNSTLKGQTSVKIQSPQPAKVQANAKKTNDDKSKADLPYVQPILSEGRLLGGIIGGKWVSDKEVIEKSDGKEKYKIYSDAKLLAEVNGYNFLEKSYVDGSKGYVADKTYIDGEKFGIVGNWNPLPRNIETETQNLEKYNKAVIDELKKSGFKDNQAVIKVVKNADFDNDGIKESLIIASNITDDEISQNSEAKMESFVEKYSIAIMQKVIGGKEKNIVVSQRFNSGDTFNLNFIADVDGDGQLEFSLSTIDLAVVPVEGWAFVDEDLYKYTEDNVESKLHTFYHPI